MAGFKNIYNSLFAGFIISVIIVFFTTRSFRAEYNPVIAGDGFGYYAYLPAKYIYNDSQLEFKWFNKAYADNYKLQVYASADDNFMVKYHNRRVNKYYPGLSLLWLPFFYVAHILAQPLGYAADGYSFPYQAAIGIASLFYLILGLVFLRKLLLRLFEDELAALIPTVFMFYGTYLYHHALNLNSLTHVYSFSFVIMMLFFARKFFHEGSRVNDFLLAILCYVIIVSVRPINALSILLVLPLAPVYFFREKIKMREFTLPAIGIILLILVFIYNQLSAQLIQTGSLFANTYTGEKFYFNRPKIFQVLFSYQAGLFVYSPILFVSLFGTIYFRPLKKAAVSLLILFVVIYIYSSWWYWPITTRALIDYYVIFAILLGALLHGIRKKLKPGVISVIVLLAAYHQLKNYQIINGILDGNLTHSELFWRNFFKVKKVNMYVVPPSSILKQTGEVVNFEKDSTGTSCRMAYAGKCSAMLTKENGFSRTMSLTVPAFFTEAGVKKMRLSFWAYITGDTRVVQVYLYFYGKDKKELNVVPFYVSESIERNKWDLKEFGYEFSEPELASLHHVTWVVWNSEGKGDVYIDEAKTEFILTDKSYEIVQ